MSVQPRPNPGDLAQILARRDCAIGRRRSVDGALFAYIDHSNVWIEGQRLQAVRCGLARDARDAGQRKITAPWAYDFAELYRLVCPAGARVGRSLLVGSRSAAESVWHCARSVGFDVVVIDRHASHKEKCVDSSIVTTMLEDSYESMHATRGDEAVLVAGDGDYIPCVLSLQRRGVRVRVVFWAYSVSHRLRVIADEFVALDPHFDRLTLWGDPGESTSSAV